MAGNTKPERSLTPLEKKMLIVQAKTRVWRTLEHAMVQMDATERAMLRDFFEGETIEKLAERHKVSTAETKRILDQLKRQLRCSLRIGCKVKQ